MGLIVSSVYSGLRIKTSLLGLAIRVVLATQYDAANVSSITARFSEWRDHLSLTCPGGYTIGYIEYLRATKDVNIGGEGKQLQEILLRLSSDHILQGFTSGGKNGKDYQFFSQTPTSS